jgi:hypothetical protein
MGRRKLTLNVTPKTLECMIKYVVVLNILNRICDMTKNLLEYPRDGIGLVPLAFSRNQNMGKRLENGN